MKRAKPSSFKSSSSKPLLANFGLAVLLTNLRHALHSPESPERNCAVPQSDTDTPDRLATPTVRSERFMPGQRFTAVLMLVPELC
jgi:hypothetical protein